MGRKTLCQLLSTPKTRSPLGSFSLYIFTQFPLLKVQGDPIRFCSCGIPECFNAGNKSLTSLTTLSVQCAGPWVYAATFLLAKSLSVSSFPNIRTITLTLILTQLLQGREVTEYLLWKRAKSLLVLWCVFLCPAHFSNFKLVPGWESIF